ncbi:VanZ family protein [Rhizobium rhizophilum]|uniref:VanZ family protein n=1 Tax=Rhizobium rhizophilum TaxID=1850373 RepID=A0ABY2QRY4_9HYPH|nr:VanZ family protein [Rhizobium rhizophilum]
MNIRRFARFAAWTGLALIVFVTILPIDARPSTVTTTDLDRALAFIVMSGLFIIAYPRRALAISIALFLAAFLIELTQFASVTRHPQMHDAVIKALGVMVGVIGGFVVNLRLRKSARAGEPRK